VIVIMTIMLVFAAYTVPRMWSAVMKRERERQTLYAMQQYAKAIYEFQEKNGKVYPTSIQQLKDAKQPRFIRGVKGELADPLTGEVDWLVIPQSAASLIPQHKYLGGTLAANPPGLPPPPPPPPPPPTDSSASDTTGTNPGGKPALPGIPIKDYAGGPFIGVRPSVKGKSLLTLFDADTYETWVYTTLDYQAERNLRIQAASTVFH
jgi:type II secretory pathway pseudopilin PulG